MQALMLAAGMGRRLGKYTDNQTKCMVPVCGVALIERAILALQAAGIHKLIMVVGYRADTLVPFLAEHSHGMDIVYVYNHDFATTNNIYSLYLAREYMELDDTLLLESDLVFDPVLLQRIVDFPAENVVALSPYLHWMHGTVTTLDESGNVTQFISGADFRYSDTGKYFKTINIYKFSKEFSSSRYIPFLEAHIRAYGTNQYYEMVLRVLASLQKADLKGCCVNDIPWYEIDDAQDLDIANAIFAKPSEKLSRIEQRFGGYWRFDHMKDFCYLVNPFFPPQIMLDQYHYFFDTLITQYPSGMNVQALLAAKMFHISEQYLLVGNGAAELINTLGRGMHGTVGVVTPVFNEYIRCFPDCTIVPINGADYGFDFHLDALLQAAQSLDAIVVVNPDNPTGSFMEHDTLFTLLDACKQHSTICIIDESFLDFAERSLRYTLLTDDILEAYPNLVVVKSISKSYGVPGLRLGVLATANRELLVSIRSRLPVWNINSFAEFFLQNFDLYAHDYSTACDRIVAARTEMIRRLRMLPSIRVYNSQANYVMCALTGHMSSTALAERLLNERNILIKDLSGKDGFQHGNYIRIAVKNEEENDQLLHALKDALTEE